MRISHKEPRECCAGLCSNMLSVRRYKGKFAGFSREQGLGEKPMMRKKKAWAGRPCYGVVARTSRPWARGIRSVEPAGHGCKLTRWFPKIFLTFRGIGVHLSRLVERFDVPTVHYPLALQARFVGESRRHNSLNFLTRCYGAIVS